MTSANAYKDALARAGLFFDDLNAIKILPAEQVADSDQQQRTSVEFVESLCWHDSCMAIELDQLQLVVQRMNAVYDEMSAQVETEKVKAMAVSTRLRNAKGAADSKDGEAATLQWQVSERTHRLAQLNAQLNAMKQEEAQQQHIINQMTSN